MRPEHVGTEPDGGVALRPYGLYVGELLVFELHDGSVVLLAEESPHAALHAYGGNGEFEGVAPALRDYAVGAVLEYLTGHGPAVDPEERSDAEGAPAAEVEVGLEVEGHLLDTGFEDESAEVPGSYAPGFGGEDELSAAVDHIPADIVVEGSGGVL